MTTTNPIGRPQVIGSAFLAVAMAAVIATVLGFQYIGGYMPCELCLKERIPYYAGIPLMLIALAAAIAKAPPALVRGLLWLGALLMLAAVCLSTYHAGVEWHWWAGPSSCTGGAASAGSDASNLLSDLDTVTPPSCDAAALRFLGLSFAGWDVIAALILAAIAATAASARPRTRS